MRPARRFMGFWLNVDLSARIARVETRRDDSSDATPEVLLAQMKGETGAIGWRRIDAARGLDAVVAEIRGAIGLIPFSRSTGEGGPAKQGSDEGPAAWLKLPKDPHPTPLRGAAFSRKWEKGAPRRVD